MQGQSVNGDLFILKTYWLKKQWPERRLQRKKGVNDDSRISDDSTEGKNNRVWAPKDALHQVEFYNVMISEFICLSLWVRNDVLAGGTYIIILAGIYPATWREEWGKSSARGKMALLVTDFTNSRCREVKLARMRAASEYVDLKRRPMA